MDMFYGEICFDLIMEQRRECDNMGRFLCSPLVLLNN